MTTAADIDTPIRLAVIIGSNRHGRFAPTVAQWFVEQAEGRGDVDVDVVDLAEVDVPAVYGPDGAGAMEELRLRIDRAAAVVVITPEYNHGYPAVLKQAIDFVHKEWQAKPIGFVSYGGISGGLRAVEQLRLVFAELHAVTVRDTVSLHNAWSQFYDGGQLVDPAPANAAVKQMLDQLNWFARALGRARAIHPYGT
jgi:NAD(P)H-dependent FMN reductase